MGSICLLFFLVSLDLGGGGQNRAGAAPRCGSQPGSQIPGLGGVGRINGLLVGLWVPTGGLWGFLWTFSGLVRGSTGSVCGGLGRTGSAGTSGTA